MGCAQAKGKITVISNINLEKNSNESKIKSKESLKVVDPVNSNLVNDSNIIFTSMIQVDPKKIKNISTDLDLEGLKHRRKSLGNVTVKIDRRNTRKLTKAVEKVEIFEKRMNTHASSKIMTKVEKINNNNFTMFPKITEDENKEKETIVLIEEANADNDNNNDIDNAENNNNNIILEVKSASATSKSKKEEEFFQEKNNNTIEYSSNDKYKINIFNVLNQQQDNENKFTNLVTGLIVNSNYTNTPSSIKEEQKRFNYATIDSSKPREKKRGSYTDVGNTIDYSSMDEDKSPSAYSPTKILRKYNLNPYHNFNVVKKYFIYQLKKSFLQAKKFVINSAIHRNSKDETPNSRGNNNANYHEIFANYSQISTTTANSYIKYEDHNVKINNYYIQKNKMLGKGGFSTVYVCKNLKDDCLYAVKITDKTIRANAKKRLHDYVKDEVNILKRLYSRYIVKTYEIIETRNECLIIMELMKNNSLFSKITKLDEFKIWKYFRNLICGVEHCHEIAKIIHRDINVNNLLISDDDIVKLSDFGVSIIMENGDDLIPVNSGPTTYTPPEKKFKDVSHYNGKPADIWCCGVTLYHMVYKRPLFKNFGALTKEDYSITLPDDPNDLIDSALKDLMINLLSENPAARYTFNDLKKNPWITKNGEFPLPDIHEEALEYVYSLTTQEIRGIKEELDEETARKDESSPGSYI